MDITIRVEWDMGHRLPNHGGLCRNLHGHRYAAEVTLRGPVIADPGAPDEGMVVDFGPVKGHVRHLLKGYDHMFLIYSGDDFLPQLLRVPGVVPVPWIPTAENIAAALLKQLRTDMVTGADVVRLRLYETPTSWADAS